MIELTYRRETYLASDVEVDLTGVFTCGEKSFRVKGFYAGDDTFKVRCLAEKPGEYQYQITGIVEDSGTVTVKPEETDAAMFVRAEGTALKLADGRWFHSFGTTVYALAHQDKELTEETFAALAQAPFNKVRMCVFPKHYDYNHNEPEFYAFCKDAEGKWDVHHPDFRFWDAFEEKMYRLAAMGIQVDLIIFHPYDRWGFSTFSQAENLVYLDYLTRRFAAIPNIWWSLANEYDLCSAKSPEDWREIEQFVADHDPFGHMLSCHNCFSMYDFSSDNITHCSIQKRTMTLVPELQKRYGKPVLYDECVYEGNLKQTWGSLSGQEMMNRFWKAAVTGGYCTHGEVLLDRAQENVDTAVLWWAKGGKLSGTSPARIGFLRNIMEEIDAPLQLVSGQWEALRTMSREQLTQALAGAPEQFRAALASMLRMDDTERARFADAEFVFKGKTADNSHYLYYYGTDCCARVDIELPTDKKYRVEVIDAWNMTRETVAEHASGNMEVRLSGREYMAVLCTEE